MASFRRVVAVVVPQAHRTLSSFATSAPNKKGGVAVAAATAGSKSRTGHFAGILVFGSLTAFTGYLGAWQAKRYLWKTDVVEQRTKQLEAAPSPLPAVMTAEDVVAYDHKVVTVTGRYDGAHQLYVGPRGAPKDTPPAAIARQAPIGWYIVTPLERDDGAGRVMVIRGWVPRGAQENVPSGPPAPDGRVSVTGVVHGGENPSKLVGACRSSSSETLLSYFGEEEAAQLAALPPSQPVFFVEAVEPVTIGTFPLTKQLPAFAHFFVMPTTHLVYSATWFSLAVCGVFMTALRFRRGGAGAAASALTRRK